MTTLDQESSVKAGGRGAATEGTYCEHTVDKVVFLHKAGVAGDRQTWEEKGRFEIDLNKIPDKLLCNDGSITSLKAYGARALLMDRASDFRKFGTAAYIAEMKRVHDTLLIEGRFDAERGSSAAPKVCQYLAQALAEVKKIDVAVATASLAAISKEQRDHVAGKLATRVAELKAAHKAAVMAATEVDLTDLMAQ